MVHPLCSLSLISICIAIEHKNLQRLETSSDTPYDIYIDVEHTTGEWREGWKKLSKWLTSVSNPLFTVLSRWIKTLPITKIYHWSEGRERRRVNYKLSKINKIGVTFKLLWVTNLIWSWFHLSAFLPHINIYTLGFGWVHPRNYLF